MQICRKLDFKKYSDSHPIFFTPDPTISVFSVQHGSCGVIGTLPLLLLLFKAWLMLWISTLSSLIRSSRDLCCSCRTVVLEKLWWREQIKATASKQSKEDFIKNLRVIHQSQPWLELKQRSHEGRNTKDQQILLDCQCLDSQRWRRLHHNNQFLLVNVLTAMKSEFLPQHLQRKTILMQNQF